MDEEEPEEIERQRQHLRKERACAEATFSATPDAPAMQREADANALAMQTQVTNAVRKASP